MFQDKPDLWRPQETKLVNGVPITYRDICVHSILMGDVEDPDIMVADKLWEWQNSDCGKWCVENSIDTPYWVRINDYNTYGHQYKIIVRLSEQNETFYRLKWGNR